MVDPETLVALTATIATNFVANNQVGIGDVARVISSVHDALAGLGDTTAPEPEAPAYVAAVSVRKSLSNPAKIISMIDGRPYSVLKRHLTTHGLTPAEYRARYNLPADYPMTSPVYAEMRRAMAKKIGLGRKPRAPVAAPAAKGRRKLKVVTAE
jgi:predicted transcriptional regulator